MFNNQIGNLMQQVQQIRQNPMQFFMQHRVNIPQEYMNDPQDAVQHMINTGQVTQQQVDVAKMYARRMGINI